MKKIIFFAAAALVAVVGCSKVGTDSAINNQKQQELSIIATNGDAAGVRGYSETSVFDATTYESLRSGEKETAFRDMQISAFLTPQNGEPGNYFVNKTFKKDGQYWKNNGESIYWPIGGVLDFLAFSLSEPKNVTWAWDDANAASKVVLNVPGENTQNDILYSSVYSLKPTKEAPVTGTGEHPQKPVQMTFKHAQAWLTFALTGTPANTVKLKSIVLEDVYNAGDLTITNNGGKALAEWSFYGEPKDIEVDNYKNKVETLVSSPKCLDMLIPEQKKTAFVLYYTLGTDPQVLSYRFTTDLKTWLAGEHYTYTININTTEITVDPSVTAFNDKIEKPYDSHDGAGFYTE